MKPSLYEVVESYAGMPSPQEVVVSFSLPYPGWCQLKESDVWRRLAEALEDAQREPSNL